MTVYPCAQCGASYEQGRRRATPYCPACRRERKLANMRAASRERRARSVAESVTDVLDDYVRQGMDPGYVDLMRDRLGDHLDEVIPHEERLQAAMPLEGANSPAGPDEGYSTYFGDLGEQLDEHAAEVARLAWWDEHPNWWVGMHDGGPIPHTATLKAS